MLAHEKREFYQRQIKATDRQIDALVYELVDGGGDWGGGGCRRVAARVR